MSTLASARRAFPWLSEREKAQSGASEATKGRIAPGPFDPTWSSLKQYKTPDWYRDAKFGIWAHWTAQCVPEQGDWYARNMYIQGTPQNLYHVATYGHPSKVGFKDIDHKWKADRWDPERLMDLYVKAGAKYFMALANHHDNLDCYASTHHTWNSTRIGPMKDIVGTWAVAARKRGLRFGASNHSAHAWHWLQTAYGYDPEGPMARVRYDGFDKKSDGTGKWWDGLDPQELYVGPSMVLPPGIKTKKEAEEWHTAHDRIWNENPPPNDPIFVQTWFERCKELVDKYDLDFLYFDDFELPLGQAGLDITAHFYNSNLKRRGQLEALVFAKKFSAEHTGAATLDLERGRSNDILELPWQTDTCIGDWHYNLEFFEQHKYKSAETVIHMLADIVSKNGNLCLNIPLRGDGTIDSDEQQVLDDLAAWMPINGEAIFGTRPFSIFGEGPPDPVQTGNFNEKKGRPYTASDFRFTAKGNVLYAIALGWPADGAYRLTTLARGTRHLKSPVREVRLLGIADPLRFEQKADALVVYVPGRPPTPAAHALRILTA